MAYFLNLFSAETWNGFRKAGAGVTGFSLNQQKQAERTISVGDIFLCYMVRVSRWCGVLEVTSNVFVDEAPLFKKDKDPFSVRFQVKPLVLLEPQHSLPVNEPEIWKTLSWTRDITPGSVGWGANFQRSLREIPAQDAKFLIDLLNEQQKENKIYALSPKDERILSASYVRTPSGEVSVSIPDSDDENLQTGLDQLGGKPEIRESHSIQALTATIGMKMGFKIWLPKSDRERVREAGFCDDDGVLVDTLPMNYNDATIRTIEQIDVLWLRGRSIARAFEIEHTTAIYSGLLRMADLAALQPDINIPLHIVAPEDRREHVFDQIKRPVFSLFETGPLADRCTYLPYSAIRDLVENPHLQHLNQSILDDYVEYAEL